MKRIIGELTRDQFSILFVFAAITTTGFTNGWWWLTRLAAFAAAGMVTVIVSDLLRWATGLEGRPAKQRKV